MGNTDVGTMVQPSIASTVVFVLIVASLGALFVWANYLASLRDAIAPKLVRKQTLSSAMLICFILASTGFLAYSGILMHLANSPALMIYFGGSNLLILGLAVSPWGRRLAHSLPLWALIAYQGFRLPLELVLHRWYEEGTLPIQMTYSGYNFDILSGIAALVVGGLVQRGYLGRRSAWCFNVFGLTLLVTVATIAVLSSPVPFRYYHEGPTVLMAFYLPFTWIIPMCVGGALFGHVVLFRRLLTNENPLAMSSPYKI